MKCGGVMRLPSDIGIGGFEMKEQTYEGQTFLEYANEAAGKIREINRIISGTELPEDDSLLGELDTCIYIMIQMYLAPVVRKEMGSDEMNNMAVEIMSVGKDEIGSVIKKYCKISA